MNLNHTEMDHVLVITFDDPLEVFGVKTRTKASNSQDFGDACHIVSHLCVLEL